MPALKAESEVRLTGATMTFELSGADGVSLAVVEGIGNCTSDSPAKLTCKADAVITVGPNGLIGRFRAAVKAAADAEVGTVGEIKATLRAEGRSPVVHTAKVEVAETVNLAAGKPGSVSVAPGADFTAPLEVRNTGPTTIKGAAVNIFGDDAMLATVRHANCRYRSDGRPFGCVFDQELKPGVTYRVGLGLRLAADAYAPSEILTDYRWLTRDDYDDEAQRWDDLGHPLPGEFGTGPRLRLEEVATTAAKAKQTDPDDSDDQQSITVTVTGKQGFDLAAIGAKATGKAGAEVDVTVSVQNKGPATRYDSHLRVPGIVGVVTLPPGTEVVKKERSCVPAGDTYRCQAAGLLRAGEMTRWTFTLKITKVVPDATGSIEANPTVPDGYDDANNSAPIVLNAASGEDTDDEAGGEAGGDEAGGAGDNGEDGGTLPITGPGGAVLGVAGAALVAAGLLGFAAARRRRTRFEA
ncbi:hypothetical protein AB0F81_24340 [Actinoplanes sp. NPDC024001]|uniref:hypothetical protein n=1 Tax=Actinoplanes sp. NPDC024001 TaxID=3154598 RepID=UPI0033BFEBA1